MLKSRLIRQPAAVLLMLLLLPAVAAAQAAITGVVKDTSGAVLPGVTVEAASPALIEKVRSVVSDATGQYRIVDLRPGTYSVTFSLTGFSTVKRDSIELTGNFVATVNGDMKVGALEETITVTGETPIVDVQSANVQQTLSKDVIAAIPSSRNASGIQSLIPGMSVRQAGAAVAGGDTGGIQGGMSGWAGTIHGGSEQSSRTMNDGLNSGFAGSAMGGGQLLNIAGAQEVVISTSGGLGEAEGGGVVLNIIPRDGGNTFSGSVFANGASGAMQGSNYTQSLKDQGLKAPSELLNVYDVSPMGGGRIIQNRLWFYLTYRQVASENTVPGMWINKNAGNPNAWTVDFDLSQQAFIDTLDRNGVGRVTWQATPRNKITAHWSEQYTTIGTRGRAAPTITTEASGRTIFQPSHIQQATWSSPRTSRLLLEAGFSTYLGYHTGSGGNGVRVDGTQNPLMIQVVDQGGNNASCNCQIPNLTSRHPNQFSRSWLGTWAWRSSASYVSGAHNMKFGYQGGYKQPGGGTANDTAVTQIRMNNGVINRLTQTVVYPGGNYPKGWARMLNLYAQDQWTRDRLTLQGGLRYDSVFGSHHEERIGGPGYLLMPTEVVYPEGKTPGVDWRDVTPRMGVAYDLFGNGKTALKFNLGKYVEGGVSGSSSLGRIATNTTRSWTDTNKNYVPECDLLKSAKNGECGDMANANFGKDVFTETRDRTLDEGWGVRTYNWSMGVSVQQEVAPRVSVTAGYFRNSWGDKAVTDNRATTLADYTPFSIKAPIDPRLPGGGGQTISGLYDLVPGKVGQVDNLEQHTKNLGELVENWQGVDVNVSARLRNGLTLQGGTATGRRLTDVCAIRAVVPEQNFGGTNNADTGREGIFTIAQGSVTNPYCRAAEPYRTAATGLASYQIPRADVQVSLTWQSNPGAEIYADYVVSNAVIAAGPQPLGRPLSGSAANVTVNLIAPTTLYNERRNNFDFRVAKVFRVGRTRSQIGFDVYNLTNTDAVIGRNYTYAPDGTWLTPTRIQPARYLKISGQFDF